MKKNSWCIIIIGVFTWVHSIWYGTCEVVSKRLVARKSYACTVAQLQIAIIKRVISKQRWRVIIISAHNNSLCVRDRSRLYYCKTQLSAYTTVISPAVRQVKRINIFNPLEISKIFLRSILLLKKKKTKWQNHGNSSKLNQSVCWTLKKSNVDDVDRTQKCTTFGGLNTGLCVTLYSA